MQLVYAVVKWKLDFSMFLRCKCTSGSGKSRIRPSGSAVTEFPGACSRSWGSTVDNTRGWRFLPLSSRTALSRRRPPRPETRRQLQHASHAQVCSRCWRAYVARAVGAAVVFGWADPISVTVRVATVLARSLVVVTEAVVADALVPAPRVATRLAVATVVTLPLARALVHVGASGVCRVVGVGRSEAELAVAAVASGCVDAGRFRAAARDAEVTLINVFLTWSSQKSLATLAHARWHTATAVDAALRADRCEKTTHSWIAVNFQNTCRSTKSMATHVCIHNHRPRTPPHTRTGATCAGWCSAHARHIVRPHMRRWLKKRRKSVTNEYFLGYICEWVVTYVCMWTQWRARSPHHTRTRSCPPCCGTCCSPGICGRTEGSWSRTRSCRSRCVPRRSTGIPHCTDKCVAIPSWCSARSPDRSRSGSRRSQYLNKQIQ